MVILGRSGPPPNLYGVVPCSGVRVHCTNMDELFLSVCFPGPPTGLVLCSLSHMNIVAGRYKYMQDLLLLAENQAPIPPLFWPRCPTPINVDLLISYLSSHPDQTFASYICTGLSNGFHIGFDRSSTRLQSASRNHPSSLANPSAVENHIAIEV